MVRTQIQLTEERHQKLKDLAIRSGINVAEVISDQYPGGYNVS